jgi:hypothetical protein
VKAVQDFNYKVALASGLKNLRTGKLPQAEEQFRYLVSKFPTADGGYRGLARVLMSKDDRSGALAALRDGAVAMSKAGERNITIDLLREATTLDPDDPISHRRLAAALALAGDVTGAAQEYVRFSHAQLDAGDPARARMEATYALETFGEIPALHELARELGISLRTVRGAPSGVAPPTPADAIPSEASPPAPPLAPPRADPMILEARAMALVNARDPEAGAAALEATHALIEVGKVQAASDLLLDLVASGISVHDAQRELIAVARALGRGDIASERERLLAEATRLG